MARTLRLEIVTPEAKAYSEDVEMVVLPGTDGELGVYPQHVPVLTTLKPGELRVFKGGAAKRRSRSEKVLRRSPATRFPS